MPELPEVETMRRGIDCCVGRRISAVEKPRCRLKPITIAPRLPTLRRRLIDRRIVDTGRVGKRVVVRLDNDEALVFEPRMTGLVLVADPPNTQHLRLRLALASGTKKASRPSPRTAPPSALLYWDRRGLGSVRLFAPAEFAATFGPEQLGPDALTISVDQLQGCLASSRREIKVALLDQRAVAGIGNLYASEILHVAGIHPQLRCDRLKRNAWEQICEATHLVLGEAIRYEGSTLSDGTYRNALNRRGRYQNYHRVYKRDGQSCPSCHQGTIQRIVQAQRSTFFCAACQSKRPSGTNRQKSGSRC